MRNILSYKQIDELLDSVKLPDYDYIVGIARDGVIPAVMLSLKKDTPLGFIIVDKVTEKIDIIPKIPRNAKILFVDNTIRTGHTWDLIKKKYPNSQLLVLFADPDNAKLADYCILATTDWQITEYELSDYKTQFDVAYDLDGVICPDPKKWELFFIKHFNWYRILRRMTMPVLFRPEPNALIITGRPLEDSWYTVKWLRKNGINNKIVFSRFFEGYENIPKVKYGFLMHYGIKTYYESDKWIADELQKLCGDKVKIILLNNNKHE